MCTTLLVFLTGLAGLTAAQNFSSPLDSITPLSSDAKTTWTSPTDFPATGVTLPADASLPVDSTAPPSSTALPPLSPPPPDNVTLQPTHGNLVRASGAYPPSNTVLPSSNNTALPNAPVPSSNGALPRCRCRPTDPCWPTPRDLRNLSSQLTFPLIPIRPPGAVCHDPTFSSFACARARGLQLNGLWRADQIGASEYPDGEIAAFGAENCTLGGDRGSGCAQGNVPLWGVNVSAPGDVQAAVQFAQARNLKLVVKNSGHGPPRSMGNNSLMLWTHNLKSITFQPHFLPDHAPRGARPQTAVTIGAGVQWGELYDAVAAHGYTIVGGFGAGGSVGAAGGWPQGGGHSALSPHYGLGADNVLQMRVVLADGRYVTANAWSHPDLFWALRGGGGPSFGVALELTYRVHPDASLVSGNFEATTNSSAAYVALLDAVQALMPHFTDNDYSGFYPFAPNFVGFTFIKLNATLRDAQRFFEPIYRRLGALPGVDVIVAQTVPYARFHDWYAAGWENGSAGAVGFNYTAGDPVGINAVQASRLLPRRVFSDLAVRANLTRALAQIPTGGRGFLVCGRAVSRVAPGAIAANPAFRSALVSMTLGSLYPEGATPEEVQGFLRTVSGWGQRLRELTPESGTYLNEADHLEPDFTRSFWGANYARLVEVKKRYDPDLVFMVYQSVGSEHWDANVDCQLTPF